MHCMIVRMATKEPPSQRVARQLRVLLDRHDSSSQDVQKRTGISYVTINRMLNAEAKTEPQPRKLRQIAAAFGESFEEVFPEGEQEIVEIGGRRVAFKALDGKPLPRDILDKIKHLTIDAAEDIHEAKRKLRKPKH
jgi:transcriptional regulator with XRE-family HTH domain